MIILWFAALAVSMSVMCFIVGFRGLPFTMSFVVAFMIAPLISIAVFPDVQYRESLYLLIVFSSTMSFGAVAAAHIKQISREFKESEASSNKYTRMFIYFGIIAIIAANIMIFRIATAKYSIGSLNDLNVAFSDPDFPSLGIYGRISRMAMPLGVACFSIAVFSKDKRVSGEYFFLSFILLLTLLGVRRSILFYQMAFYLLIYMSSIFDWKSFLKSIGLVAITLLAGMYVFGFIQIATNKSEFSKPLESGFYEGALYVSGNLPYSECLLQSSIDLPKGNSFPIIFQFTKSGINRDLNIYKPFCSIRVGQKFNTSPMYFDIYSDFGMIGVICFGLLFGVVAILLTKFTPFVGLQVIFTTSILFGFRESLLGLIDIIQAMIVYPFIIIILVKLSLHGTSRR